MPAELLGALIDIQALPADFRAGRGDLLRLAKRGVEFFQATVLVPAVASTFRDGLETELTNTPLQGDGGKGAESLGKGHDQSFFEVLCYRAVSALLLQI